MLENKKKMEKDAHSVPLGIREKDFGMRKEILKIFTWFPGPCWARKRSWKRRHHKFHLRSTRSGGKRGQIEAKFSKQGKGDALFG